VVVRRSLWRRVIGRLGLGGRWVGKGDGSWGLGGCLGEYFVLRGKWTWLCCGLREDRGRRFRNFC